MGEYTFPSAIVDTHEGWSYDPIPAKMSKGYIEWVATAMVICRVDSAYERG